MGDCRSNKEKCSCKGKDKNCYNCGGKGWTWGEHDYKDISKTFTMDDCMCIQIRCRNCGEESIRVDG